MKTTSPIICSGLTTALAPFRRPILLGLIAFSLGLPLRSLPADQFTRFAAIRKAVSSDTTWGCNWVDIDADHDIDLILMNGAIGDYEQSITVLRNEGLGRFTQLTAEEAGPIVSRTAAWGFGTFGDLNNDGYPDGLAGGAELETPGVILESYLGQAGGRFTISTDLLPFTNRIGHLALADYDRDGWLDAFVGTAHMYFLSKSGLRPTLPIQTNMLLRNLVGTKLDPVAAPPLAGESVNETQAAAWGDYDGDGDADLLITLPIYSKAVRLYENLGQGSFRRAASAGFEIPEGLPMVPAWTDYDNDGRLDLAVSVDEGVNILLHNEGNGGFTRISLGGTALQNRQPAWADYDNDGWPDLIVSGGDDTPQECQLWHNNGNGTFTRITTEGLVNETGLFHAAAWADMDNDGFLDVLLAGTGLNLLYRNNGNTNHWLKLELVGTTSNRSAVGAKVRVRATVGGRELTQLREITAGSRCQDDMRAHFGLGDATLVQLMRIEWPSGLVQEFSQVAADQILVITEPRRPFLTVATVVPNRVAGSIQGDPNTVYHLESSPDLVTWKLLEAATTDARGLAPWSEADPADSGRQFYRARRP